MRSQLNQLGEKKRALKKSLEEIGEEMGAVKEMREQNRQELEEFKKNVVMGLCSWRKRWR